MRHLLIFAQLPAHITGGEDEQVFTFACHLSLLSHVSGSKLTVAGVSGGHLSQISVVIALHFEIEDLAFRVAGFGNQVFVQETLQMAGKNTMSLTAKDETRN